MTPTPKLRFVERIITFDSITKNALVKNILQQWWEHTQWDAEGEWRDVPIEKEQA